MSDVDQVPRLNRTAAIRGCAVLREMLGMIGEPDADNGTVAKALVDGELDLHELLTFSLQKLTLDLSK